MSPNPEDFLWSEVDTQVMNKTDVGGHKNLSISARQWRPFYRAWHKIASSGEIQMTKTNKYSNN